MKNLKKLISVLLAVCMMMGITSSYTVFAMESESSVFEDIASDDNGEELTPMMARSCVEDDLYPLINGYYGSPGTSGGSMRVMTGGLSGAYNFFTFLTGYPGVINETKPINGGGTARITYSNSAASGYAVQIKTAVGQPFKSQRVHFD